MIQYFGTDGAAFNCYIQNNRVTTLSVRYQVKSSVFGLAGLAFSNNPETEPLGYGWNVVGDNASGLLYQFVYDRKRVYSSPGWVQTEIPAVAVEVCKGMPNNGKVNQAQVSGDFQDLLANSKRVTGFKVAFPNNPQGPMTAGMFYHFYRPSN